MKLPRRQFLHLAAGAGALPRLAQIAWAQTYPSRPVRIIVGFPAGSATDIVARLIGQSLSERLGQQVLVENRPGTGSNIAAAEVVRATANGYVCAHVGTLVPHRMPRSDGRVPFVPMRGLTEERNSLRHFVE